MGTSKVSTRWPKPTVSEPDLKQLMMWLFTDLCEATDGCEVKANGICPHGNPSWLLRKEMI